MKVSKSVKALKTEDYSINEVVVKDGTIVDIVEKETEYGDRALMKLKSEGEELNIFLNQTSLDNLIEKFGEETDDWVGEKIKVTCKKGTGKYKQALLLVEPKD